MMRRLWIAMLLSAGMLASGASGAERGVTAPGEKLQKLAG